MDADLTMTPAPVVVLDLDGVLIETEEVWHDVRRDYAARFGGSWTEEDQRAVMGANSSQWARHIRERFGVPLGEQAVIDGVVDELLDRYRSRLPVLPGAVEAVQRLAGRFVLGLASSSPERVIRWVLDATGLAGRFRALVSSDEVVHGKPAPDVYCLALERLHASPGQAVAVEDSGSGILAAHRAGMAVIAVPNRAFPPPEETLALAGATVSSIAEVVPELIERVAAGRGGR